ncbi:MAG: heat-inducible transcriptional repressor HrcA [Oscillospiraceae bacterium]|nr:heat-inducible transcriptional repressor HrcA [Oscillospiraceae bacterium]
MRRLKILKSVIERYIESGEPVGSKVIADQFDHAISSATVRNDMAALEKMGYLIQPHTSAGRIPTGLGYRFYISHLMRREPLSDMDREIIEAQIVKGDLNPRTLVSNATDLLAKLTDCAIVSAMSEMGHAIITRVDILPAGRRLYAILVITSGGAVENRVCRLEFDLQSEQIAFFLRFIRENLVGMRIDDLTDERLVELGLALGSYTVALAPLLYGVYDITRELRRQRVEIKNETSLLRRGVFQSGQYTDLMNNRQQLGDLMEKQSDGTAVIFGQLDTAFAVEGSTLIVSPYRQGTRTVGSLAVLGPLRMDYGRVLPFVEYLSDTISRLMTEGLDEDRSKPSRVGRGPTDLAPSGER